MNDTIFALSSGAPPAAIGVIRISGPLAGATLTAMAGRAVSPRRPSLTRLAAADGRVLDEALVLWFPGKDTATGEDLAELHCHGGRAVIAALCAELASRDGLRAAEPGEFTRRAFINGRLDLSEAEGLADLLSAETEMQRSAAMAMAGGAFSSQVETWRSSVLALSAEVEGVLDFSDEEDSEGLPTDFMNRLAQLTDELTSWLERPRAERLGGGFRVLLSGPPNAGKSSLFNVIIEDEAAIVTPIAGTTRDVIERSVALQGVPFTFIDSAGIREGDADVVESIGVERARAAASKADLVLWLGLEGEGPMGAWEIVSRVDSPDHVRKEAPRHRVSAVTGEGLDRLKADLIAVARTALPKPGEAALNARQHALLDEACGALRDCLGRTDPLLIGEELRTARLAFDRLIGRATTEDMLDTLFGRFCIGK